MRITFKSFCFALGAACLPAMATAESYLPLPETSAPAYRPVSSYYDAEAPVAEGTSLIHQVDAPPAAGEDDVPNPNDAETPVESPAASYGKSVVKGGKCASKGCGKSCGKGCGYGGCGIGHLIGGRGCWYGSGGVVYFRSDRGDNLCLSVFDTAENVSVLDMNDAQMDWTAGGEFTIGRYLGGGCHALELNYWEIDPNLEQASVLDPNDIATAPNLVSAFDMSTLNYDDGLGGGVSSIDGWFNGARVHRLTRDLEFRNLELNFVHHSCCGTYAGLCGGCRRYNVTTLAGIRYLNYDESFRFDADETDTTFTGAPEEVYYSINTENHLLGFQLGYRADYYHTCCFALHSTAKAGIYGNFIDHESYIGGANGAAVVGAGPNAGREFDVASDKTDFAMIAEMDLGASYQLSCRWRVRAGYRVIGVCGVATPGGQIPYDFRDIDGVANIGSEDCLVLHGGYAGLDFNF